MKGKKKLNEGCLRIFKFIELLYEDKAYYDDVIKIFKDEINEQSANNIQVTLNKYINTLKIFGLKIIKVKNKYKMLSSLYSVDFTLDDLKSLCLLETSAKEVSGGVLYNDIEEIFKNIQMRMNSEDKTTFSNLINQKSYDFSFYYSDIKDQIKQCEDFCKGDFQLNIVYKQNGQEFHSKINPVEVIYDSKTAYLKAYDSIKRQNLEIPINCIIELKQSCQKTNPTQINTTAVYKLKGRLAKIYKLKENEYSTGFDDNGCYIVVNKNEPYDKLIQRLMKYGANCEITSPKFLREQMLKTINDVISNYE